MSAANSNSISTSKGKVLTVGIAVADYVFQTDTIPSTPEKHFANDQFETAGGIAVNAALAVTSLGGEAVLLSRVGDDSAGMLIREKVREGGVDISNLETCRGLKSASSAVIVDRDGERMIVNQRPDGLFTSKPDVTNKIFSSVGCVLGDLRWTEGTDTLFALARENNVPTVLDFDLTNAGTPDSILASSDHIVFGEAALKRFVKRVDLNSALRAAQDAHPESHVAVTSGSDGVRFINRDGKLIHIPARQVTSLSTLGAGDVFHGAAALAIAEKCSFERALRFANDVAALKVSKPASQSYVPTRSEVDAFQRSFT